MNAKVDLTINKEDLGDTLTELVRELASSELKQIIQEQAKELVTAEIDKILQPLVLKILTENEFEFNTNYLSYTQKHTIDQKLTKLIVEYLNRPSYVYSKSKRAPSERYMATSSGGDQTSLINHIIKDEIALFVDVEFVPKVREMIQELVGDKTKLEQIFHEQAKELVLQKF